MEQTYTERIQIDKKNKFDGMYPITKFWIVMLFMLTAFILDSWHLTEYKLPILLIPWFLVNIVLMAISNKLKVFFKAYKAVFWVAVVVFFAQLFLIPGEQLIWHYGFFNIYAKGLRSAISLTFMILDVAGLFIWLFQTTSNKEMTQALEESGMNYKSAFMFVSSLRMIDILGASSKTIMNAQRARGVETEGNMLTRAKAFFPTLVPLMLSAIIGADERAMTLEARGFNYMCDKTHLFSLKKSGIEKQALIAAILITLAIFAGRILWAIR